MRRIGGALEAATTAGIRHGRVSANAIVYDERGEPYLTDFTLGRRSGRTECNDLHDLLDVVTGPPAARHLR